MYQVSSCTTPSKVIILKTLLGRHGPITVIDRLKPDSPTKTYETPGCKSKFENNRVAYGTLHKYNHLMVANERSWSQEMEDLNVVFSFWDMRDEPLLFKEENLMDMLPSAIWSKQELGEGHANLADIDIEISSGLMAVHIVIKITSDETQDETFRSFTLLYGVNTAEPSQDQDIFHLRKIVKHLEDACCGIFQKCWAEICMNEKYLIRCNFDENKDPILEVSVIDTLLSSVDTKSSAKTAVRLSFGGCGRLEPGMSDRLAIFNYLEHSLTIIDLVSTKSIITIDTIQWSIIGQPSEKKCFTDPKIKIFDINVFWCCGNLLFLQRQGFPYTGTEPQWAFKVSIVDPGDIDKRAANVKTEFKEIWDFRIGFPWLFANEDFHIDFMGIAYVVSDYDGITTVHCSQFHNENAYKGESAAFAEASNKNFVSGLLIFYYHILRIYQ